MGAVYRAYQESLDRDVAVKILPLERVDGAHNYVERFKQEAWAMGKLNHPSILSVYEFGASDDFLYIVMEYIRGKDLRCLIREGPMNPALCLKTLKAVCEALLLPMNWVFVIAISSLRTSCWTMEASSRWPTLDW